MSFTQVTNSAIRMRSLDSGPGRRAAAGAATDHRPGRVRVFGTGPGEPGTEPVSWHAAAGDHKWSDISVPLVQYVVRRPTEETGR
ncbi:hypothetical protein GCM10027570_38480 [Streptomonospora sediminis]